MLEKKAIKRKSASVPHDIQPIELPRPNFCMTRPITGWCRPSRVICDVSRSAEARPMAAPRLQFASSTSRISISLPILPGSKNRGFAILMSSARTTTLTRASLQPTLICSLRPLARQPGFTTATGRDCPQSCACVKISACSSDKQSDTP